jgi:RHS repeat-associated protein
MPAQIADGGAVRRVTEPRKGAELSDAEVDQRFYAIITDLVGTPTHLVGDTGEAAWHANTALWGGSSSDQDARCPLRFPGQYADAETGWHYNLYRHYDPQISRYTSPDPLGLDPAPNAYSYPRNPHTWTDPLGLLQCREAARRQALSDARVPDGAEPLEVRYTPSTTPGGRQILDENYQPVHFREEVHLNDRNELIVYQDHHTGHQFGDPNGVGDQPPHVHVRPYDDPRNGQIPGCQEHYYYDPSLG